MTATLRMINALFPPLLSGEAHYRTVLCIPDLAQPRKLAVVLDDDHPGEAVLLQRIARLAGRWKPKRQHAFLRARPPSGSYNPVERRCGLPPAAPERSDEHALRVRVYVRRHRQRQRAQRRHAREDAHFPWARFFSRAKDATERHQAAVHLLLEGEVFAREHAVTRKGDPVVRPLAVRQAAAVEDDVAEAREAAEEFNHVGIADAGGGEVEEGDVREGRPPAAGAQGAYKVMPRDAQAERVGAGEERRGGEV